ncbi:L-2-hydroxyglutarate oxidase [bacterium]|nr:L-2-hydroxyglutarate oxidase [bacterium]
MSHPDVVIVGGGIVGLATALKLQNRHAQLKLKLIEAEPDVAQHQSGHNSGVLHSGIYYKPGSKKAICCRTGKQEMEDFCAEHSIAWDKCGKVVVATSESELTRLDDIAERAKLNAVRCERINTDQLRELEPAAAGISALHVPETGIVNYRSVCRKMAQLLRENGASIELNFELAKITHLAGGLELKGRSGQRLECGNLINCGGLQSDRVCKMAGVQTNLKVVPFRGEYYELAPNSEPLCRNLIYPVPDPSFPFLGVHFTRMIDGGVECGPNAVLALAREGYRWRDISMNDLADTIRFRGFRKLAAKHWRMGLGEMHRSISKQAFVNALQKLVPSIRSSDLVPGRAGVRAQTVTPGGDLVDDFLFEVSDHAIHVLNAPSPAATASLAIADHIVDKFTQQFA